MRDQSFHLEPSLFAAIAPLRHDFVPEPWRWTVRDAANTLLATAKTRAGARAATRWIYSNAGEIDHG